VFWRTIDVINKMRSRRRKFIVYHYKKFRREYEEKGNARKAGKDVRRERPSSVGRNEAWKRGRRGGSRTTIAYLPLWKRGIKGDLKNIHLLKNLPSPLFSKEGGMLNKVSLPGTLIF
jgi:hypothetical protein